MRQIAVSEETFKKLIELKNHWSFQHRKVTNKEVLKILENIKLRIYGYNSSMTPAEIEEIAKKKSREQLEKEMEAFGKAYKELLVSGYDFEPEYTLDEHIKKMIELINQGEEVEP